MDDPHLLDYINSLPMNYQNCIAQYKSFTDFIKESLSFSVLNGYVCVTEDSKRAIEMPYGAGDGVEYARPPEAQLSHFVQHELENQPPVVKRKPAVAQAPIIPVKKEFVIPEIANKHLDKQAGGDNNGFDLDQFLTNGSRSAKESSKLKLDNLGSALGGFGAFVDKQSKVVLNSGTTTSQTLNLPKSKDAGILSDFSIFEPGGSGKTPTLVASGTSASRQSSEETPERGAGRDDTSSSVLSESSSRTDRDLLRAMFNDSPCRSPGRGRATTRRAPLSMLGRPSSHGSGTSDVPGQVAEHKDSISAKSSGDERPASSNSMGSLSSFGVNGQDRQLSRTTSSDISDPTGWDITNSSVNNTSEVNTGSEAVERDWSYFVDKTESAGALLQDQSELPKHFTTPNGYLDAHTMNRADSFSEGEEYECTSGPRSYGPIGSRIGSSKEKTERSPPQPEPLNTFPSAHDETGLKFKFNFSTPVTTSAGSSDVNGTHADGATHNNPLPIVSEANISIPFYNFGSNPAAQINPSSSIWGPPITELAPLAFTPITHTSPLKYDSKVGKQSPKDTAVMKRYQKILAEEAQLENVSAQSSTTSSPQKEEKTPPVIVEEVRQGKIGQMAAFEEVSRLWTNAEVKCNNAKESADKACREAEELRGQLEVKTTECTVSSERANI